MAEFGENLKRVREEKGITQQTLADYLYVTRQAISRWEGGSRYPDLMTAKKMAQYFGISLDEMLSDDDMKLYAEKNAIMESSGAKKVQMIIFSIALTSAIMTLIMRVCWYFLIEQAHNPDWGFSIFYSMIPILALTYGTYAIIKDNLNAKKAGTMIVMMFSFYIIVTIYSLAKYLYQGIASDTIGLVYETVFGLVVDILILVFGIRFFWSKKMVSPMPIYIIMSVYMVVISISCFNALRGYFDFREHLAGVFNEIAIIQIFSYLSGLFYYLAIIMMVHVLNKKRRLAARTVANQ